MSIDAQHIPPEVVEMTAARRAAVKEWVFWMRVYITLVALSAMVTGFAIGRLLYDR
jgi:hypothetical protein